MSKEDVLHEWYYQLNGREVGPISAAEIKQLLFGRQISKDTYIWRNGFTDWKRVRETDLGAARVRLQSQNDQPAEPDQDAARETLGGFTRDDDSFAEAAVSAETKSPGYDDWYYVIHGEKKGPVSAVAIKNRLNNKDIAADTHVWRKGMKDWCTIRESELYAFVESEPPPLSSHLIGDSFVWIMAFLPLIFAVLDASISAYNQNESATFWSLGFTPHLISENLSLKIYGLTNGLFGWLDYRRLKKAGYGAWWRRVLAFFIPVIYLFIRAKLLKQRPYYAIAWLVMFVLGLLIDNN